MSNKEVLIRTKHEILKQMENQSAYDILKVFARNSRKGIHFLVLGFLITTFQLFYIRMSYNVNRSPLEGTFGISVNKSANTKLLNFTDSYLSMANDNETQSKYFTYTSQCRIPYVDPFDGGVSKFFNPKDFKYTNCTNDEPFITINYHLNAQQYLLHMNIEAIERAVKPLNASARDVRCCYQQIVRAESGGKADNNYKLLNCVIFHQNFVVPQHIDYIITECYIDEKSKRTIQKDTFSFIQTSKARQLKNITGSISKNQSPVLDAIKPSVLLLGIDALSRINLRRTMPLTFKYLKSNQWFELQGYNKVGDNTFPNLMPLLTSYNSTTAKKKCLPQTVGGLNQPVCNFIWNNFKQFGYKTAYAEDTCSMSTFNYFMEGFDQPPTDYYLRPMALAIEKELKVVEKGELPYCVGRKHYAEYIYDYALQFANAFAEEPFFGLFWSNSFSHNFFDNDAAMDAKVWEYLEKLKSDGILERSIVILLSDHGMRWGPLLQLKSGFLEERLPTMFISIPSWYQNKYPDFMKNLQTNQRRLTTPYDIYATMKHILEVAEPENGFPYLNDTIHGVSIFREIPENRTCNDAGIPEHWCACVPYEIVPTSDEVAKNVTALVLGEMNQYLFHKNISDKCAELKLETINSVVLKMIKVPNESTYRINFEANAKKAKFQATVVYNITTSTIKTDVGDISRLDSYAKTSNCIDLKEEKKYCVCRRIEDQNAV